MAKYLTLVSRYESKGALKNMKNCETIIKILLNQ